MAVTHSCHLCTTRRGTDVEYRRRGVFEFNSARHDQDAKRLLGHDIQGDGLAEIDRVIDLLARHPSTVAHISRKLAVYFVSDDPPQDLVKRLSQVFLDSDGDGDAIVTMVVAEIACGTPLDRTATLSSLGLLQQAQQASTPEVLRFIDREKLYGLGCAIGDMVLLASTLVTPGAQLWTLDKRLASLANQFGVQYASAPR